MGEGLLPQMGNAITPPPWQLAQRETGKHEKMMGPGLIRL